MNFAPDTATVVIKGLEMLRPATAEDCSEVSAEISFHNASPGITILKDGSYHTLITVEVEYPTGQVKVVIRNHRREGQDQVIPLFNAITEE